MPHRAIDDEDDSDDDFEPYSPTSPQWTPSDPEYRPTDPEPPPEPPREEPPPQAAFPIDALGPDVRALFEHLECSVCLELQADMLVVCDGGHSVCKVCYDGVCNMGGSNSRKCPTCRNAMAIPRPNLAVNGVAAALGLQPRAAAPAAPAAAPAPAPAAPAQPVVQMDAQRRVLSSLRRSLLGKLKVRVRQVNDLREKYYNGDILMSEANYTHRMNRILAQVTDIAREWRCHVNRAMPVHMPTEVLEAFNLGQREASSVLRERARYMARAA